MAFPDIDRALFSADLVQIRRRTAPNVFVSAFPAARPIQATVSETGRLMSHPLEDGSSIVDHRIIFPTVITLSIIIDPRLVTFRPLAGEFGVSTYRSTYNEIREDFRNSTQFEIQTKSRTYENMYLQNIPHEETPNQFDTITMILEFSEAKFSTVVIQALSMDQVADPADSSTLEKGAQTSQNEGNRGGSTLSRFFGSLFG